MPGTTTLPTTERLLGLVDAMAGRPVLMLADLVVDRFITGTPKRISREAPVLILRYEGETSTPGGGANAVANVAALGGRPLVLGVVGEDAAGEELVEELARRGVSSEGVRRRPGYRTPTKVRILGGGRHAIKQQIVRYDVEDRIALGGEDRRHFTGCLERWAGEAPVAVVSDYGYGAVEPAMVSGLRSALAPGGAVLGDSRYRLGDFVGLDGATPNEEECEAILGEPLPETAEDLQPLRGPLLARLRAGFLVVTRGSRGMNLLTREGVAAIPVHGTDQVADVTGAGDTVIGAFALALAAGASPLEAALIANYAGGVVVMKMGTATLGREELRAAVASDPELLERLRWAGS